MQLTLKIRDIPDAGLHLEGPLPAALVKDGLAGLEATASSVEATPIVAALDVARSGDTVTVHGRLTGDVRLPCNRCLEEAHLPIAQRLHVILGPASMGAEDSADEEIEYFNHNGEVIDLETVLRESLIMAVPMVVLCQPDCQGLCPVCGGNRNERACGCSVPVIDPRLSPLQDLKNLKNLKL